MFRPRSLFPALLLSIFGFAASSCRDGGSDGGSSEAGHAPEITILEPTPGQVLNTDTPSVLASFGDPAPDLATVVVEIDGHALSLDGWLVVEQGISGTLPPQADGKHDLEISAESPKGARGKVERSFEISTGGGATRIRGDLLDPDGDVPIAGAAIYVEEDPTIVALTQADGSWELADGATALPTGPDLHVLFDPRGLEFEDSEGRYVYPVYKRVVEVVAGATNVLDPCYLPKVRPHVTFEELASNGVFDCASQRFLRTYDLSVDVSESDDEELVVALTIPAGTYVDFLGGADACADGMYLAIAPVDKHKAPSNLPPGADPSLLVTVQPTGMAFRTSPNGEYASLPICFPNRDGFPAETAMLLYSVDHETGEFRVMGTMEVDPRDTTRIVTVTGGLQGGSWHCSCPPEPNAQGDAEGFPSCEFDQVELNPVVDTRTGFYRETYALPTRLLYDEPWGDALVYSSLALNQGTMLAADVEIPRTSAVPERISVSATVAGIPVGDPLWFDSSDLPEEADSMLTLPVPLDVQLSKTGLYPFQLEVRNHFQTSSVTAFLSGLIPRIVEQGADFGRGWALASDARVVEAIDQSLLLVEGPATLRPFRPQLLTETGLGLSFYAFEGPVNPYWTEQVLTFFEGRDPLTFTEYLGGQEPHRRTETILPSVDFPPQPSTPYFRYAGPNGRWETSNPEEPQGDDAVYEVASHFGALFEGYLYVPFADDVQFAVEWDNGAALEVNGQIVLAQHGSIGTTTSDPIPIEAGLVPIRLAFFDHGGQRRLRLAAKGAGYDWNAPLPPTAFFSQGELEISDTFLGTRGDTSTLTRLAEGGYRRDLDDGGRELFDAGGRIVSRADRRGRTAQFVREAGSGALLSIVDPVGGSTELVRSGGRVVAIVDPAGRTTELAYAGPDLVAITDPTGAVWRYGYDGDGHMTTTTNADGRTNQFEVAPGGRIVAVRYPDGAEASVEPLHVALLEALADGAGDAPNHPALPPRAGSVGATLVDEEQRTTVQFGGPIVPAAYPDLPQDARLWTRREPLGEGTVLWTLRVRDRESGLPLLTQTWEGPADGGPEDGELVAESRSSWNLARGLLLESVESGLGTAEDRVTRYVWHASRPWLLELQQAAGTPIARTTSLAYDERGNVTSIEEPSDGGGAAKTLFEYGSGDALAKLVDPVGITVEVGREHASGSATSVTVGGRTTGLVRSATGAVERSVRPDGAETTCVRDALDRLLETVDALGGRTAFGRLASGRTAWVRDAKTPPGEGAPRYEHGYDARGRLSSWSDPLGGTRRFEYTASGRLTRLVEPSGITQDMAYDAGGRLVRIDLRPDPEAPVADHVELGRDALGRLTRVTTPTSEVRLGLDAFGEIEREEQDLAGGETWTAVSAYDALGRRTTMRASLGSDLATAQELAYGTGGLLSTVLAGVGPGGGAFVGGFVLQRDAAGRRVELVRTPSDLRTTYTYDLGTGALLETRNLRGSVLLGSDRLDLDPLGFDIVGLHEVRTLLSPVSVTFQNDAVSRLEASLCPEEPLLEGTFAPYDGVGNRRVGLNEYDAADHLLTDRKYAYAYDADGALVERRDLSGTTPTRTFERDLLGRITRVVEGDVELLACGYDGLGRRAWLRALDPATGTVEEGRFLYDGEDVVATSREGELRQVVVHGPGFDEPWTVTDLQADGTPTTQLMSDALGSVAQLVVDGQVVGEQRYDAFGEPLSGSNEGGDLLLSYGYRGREYDRSTGLWFNRARYYDPHLGRFLARDPRLSEALQSGWAAFGNPYVYAADAPLTYADPSGEILAPIVQGLIARVRGAAGAAFAAGRAAGRVGLAGARRSAGVARAVGKWGVFFTATWGWRLWGWKPWDLGAGYIVKPIPGLWELIDMLINPVELENEDLDSDGNGIPDWKDRWLQERELCEEEAQGTGAGQ